jgi:hypothetical protein
VSWAAFNVGQVIKDVSVFAYQLAHYYLFLLRLVSPRSCNKLVMTRTSTGDRLTDGVTRTINCGCWQPHQKSYTKFSENLPSWVHHVLYGSPLENPRCAQATNSAKGKHDSLAHGSALCAILAPLRQKPLLYETECCWRYYRDLQSICCVITWDKRMIKIEMHKSKTTSTRPEGRNAKFRQWIWPIDMASDVTLPRNLVIQTEFRVFYVPQQDANLNLSYPRMELF